MLGKLIKHETRATSRIFLPLYGALLILTIFTKLALAFGAPDFFSDNVATNPVIEVVLGISFTLYFIAVVALSAMTLVMIIQRFYKNLFTDEGYLMFSLPVKTWELVLSKLLVGLIWSAVCTLMIVISFFILSLGSFTMMDLTQGISMAYTEFYSTFGTSLNVLIFEIMMLIVISTISSILMIYVSIAIGQLFNQHRIVASFGAYIVITIALQIIGSILMAIFALGNLDAVISQGQDGEAMQMIHLLINGSTLCNVILCVGFYFATQYIMKNRLNLE
jgi:hypothetical protein